MLDKPNYFDNNRTMEMIRAVTALSALAQESRLAIFRLLVQSVKGRLSVGQIKEMTGIPGSSLSFHLKELSHADLISSCQEGRFIYYSANYNTMNAMIQFLTENCCDGKSCKPEQST